MTTRTVTVKLRAEVAAYLRNMKASEKATKDLETRVERLDKAAHALTKVGLVASIAAIPGVIAPAGAALASLPGLVFGAAGSFGVLAMSVHGVGGAMKAAAEGDAKKLSEELKGLSGEARRFIAEYQQVEPVLDRIADHTQDQFWIQLRGDLKMLAENYLPTMLHQLPRLASELGRGGHELAQWAASPVVMTRVNRQLDLAADLTSDWTRLLKAANGMMLDLADSSTDFNRRFVGGMADGAEAMERWVNRAKVTGQLNGIYQNAQRVMSKLMQITAQLGELLFDIMANPALTDATLTLLDLLSMSVDILHTLLKAFSSLPTPVQSAIASLIAFGGGILLIAGRIAAMKAAVGSASIWLEGLGTGGHRAATGLQRGAEWAGRAAAAFVGLQVAGMLISNMQDQLNPQIDAMATGLQRWAESGELSGEAARILGKDIKDLDVGLKFLADTSNGRRMWARNLQDSLETLIPGLSGTNTSLTKTRERVTALDQALARLVQQGKTYQAAIVFNDLARTQEKYGVSVAELRVLFPQYNGAVEEASKSTADLSAAQLTAAMNAAVLNQGLAGAVKEAGSLEEAFNRLHGATLSLAGAEITAEQALDDLIEAFKENGKTLDITNEKGRENKKLLIQMVEASIQVAQKKYDETVATKGEAAALAEANAVYQSYIGQLRSAMLAAGMTKAQVDQLLASWTAMPQLIQTTITTPGLDTAIAKMNNLLALRGQLGSNAAASNAYGGSGYTSGRRWGGVTEHARNGLLRQAQTFQSVTTGARYAFAEPATKGEAFIPKSGNRQRSLGILGTAAGWYGHTLAPMGGMAGGGGVQTVVHKHEHTYTIKLSGREQVSGFRREVRLSGGKVQDFAGSRTS